MDSSSNLLNKLFFSKYKIKSFIGKGQYSEIYSVENIINKKLYAAKLEKREIGKSELLEKESYFLMYLKGFGIPEIITYGHSGKYNVLIQQLLGKTLIDIFKIKKNKIKDLCMSAIQLIDRIEYIHSKYIIHRDIKPENFLIGNPDSSTIYLIDFGFARKYRSSRTKKHISYRINKFFPGTIAFLSINASKGVEQTRRDDLESLAYSLIYLGTGTLPWMNLKAKTILEYSFKIYKIKNNISIEDLCKGLPKGFENFTEYVKGLKFDEDPNYSLLKNFFVDILKNMNREFNTFFFKIDLIDRNKTIDSQKGNYSFYKKNKRTSPRKRILKSLEGLRTSSENKTNGNNTITNSGENTDRKITYNDRSDLNLLSKKNKQINKIQKLNKISFINDNKIIKTEPSMRSTVPAQITYKTNTKLYEMKGHLNNIYSKDVFNTISIVKTSYNNRLKRHSYHNKKSPLIQSNISAKLNNKLFNDIDYIPKTKNVKLIYDKLNFRRVPTNIDRINKNKNKIIIKPSKNITLNNINSPKQSHTIINKRIIINNINIRDISPNITIINKRNTNKSTNNLNFN